jgi:hypothetical protein
MSNEMRTLTAKEVDSISGGSSLSFVINPQFNVGLAAAFAVGGDAKAVLVQKNIHVGLVAQIG